VAGKKAGRAVAGKRSGPTGPLPLGDTVHRQRPNTCVTASGKRTTDLGYRFHDNGFLQAERSKAETVKQTDRAARDQGHDDFASLTMATRCRDKPMQNGWPEFSAWTSLAATMPSRRGEQRTSSELVIRGILAVAAARGCSRRASPLLRHAPIRGDHAHMSATQHSAVEVQVTSAIADQTVLRKHRSYRRDRIRVLRQADDYRGVSIGTVIKR